MAVETRSSRAQSADSEQLRAKLERLLQSSAGSIVLDQFAHLTAEWQGLESQLGQTYRQLLRLLLEDVAQDPSSEHVLALAAQFIQIRRSADVHAVQPLAIPQIAARLADDIHIDVGLDRLLARLGGAPPPETRVSEPRLPESPVAEPRTVEPRTSVGPGPARPPPLPQAEVTLEPPADTSAAELRVTSVYRQHLERKRDEIERLQSILALNVREAVTQNKEFGDLLQIERNALQKAESLQEVGVLRQILIGGIEELLKGQQALASNLTSTSEYLQAVESDSEQLREELQKVRLLSLTDDSTGLANRRAFLRRLDDEIERAQRHSAPLALAILDLDEFKAINDTYGHIAGDEILRCYATQVLSMFRQYDMVARYGGEEFAVLLPNTVLDGARCALRKVQARAAALRCDFDGHSLPLPTFSCGLTLYLPGESATVFIERADHALYRAKHYGRNRIEVDIADKLAGAVAPAGTTAGTH